MIRQLAVAMALALAAPADAAMDYAEDDSFKLVVAHVIQATPDQIYRMLGQPRRWWSSAHTYSGDARNLKMELRAGGCFCETMPKGQGSIEHGRVVQAMKGKLLRLSAPLGPLQDMAVTGTLTWTLDANAGPLPSTMVMLVYNVNGDMRGSGKALAPAVDRVLHEQMWALTKLFEKRE
jgi:uncharacterized protein YndB with AHSA1/START domain